MYGLVNNYLEWGMNVLIYQLLEYMLSIVAFILYIYYAGFFSGPNKYNVWGRLLKRNSDEQYNEYIINHLVTEQAYNKVSLQNSE